jgi:subtilisin family serine protease
MMRSPGTGITSAWFGSSTASKTLSGTSMSTPVVTGVAALYLEKNPSMTPLQVKQAMVADGSLGVVQSSQGSPNILISTANLSGSSPAAPVTTSVASPVRAPTPVSRPVTAPTPVRKPTPVSSPVSTTKPTRSGSTCDIFLSPCQSKTDNQCCSGICRLNLCVPF